MNKSMRSMIKRVVIPNNTDIHIMVPQAYVGKKVELILFTLDETDEEQNILPTKPKASSLRRSVPSMTNEQIDQKLNEIRSEWEKGF